MSDSTLVNDANDATDEIANENGESTDAVGQTSDITIENDTYSKLLEQGLSQTVASRLSEIIQMGKLAYDDLDTRAFEALKEFPTENAVLVLDQFVESCLEHVSNKSAYLCGMMKTFRQKQKSAPQVGKGPDEEKIKAILERTKYTLDVTAGQRKYGGPPPDWEGAEPGPGCEVFCGKIPKEVYEDELILLFEKSGKIYDLRLMMDPMTGVNRGYAFITYTTKEEADQAAKDLDNYEIKPGRKLKVNVSVPNLRLFVGNIPKSKGKEDILAEFGKLTGGLINTIIYSSPDDRAKNRGFCFLEYESHKAASVAKKKLGSRPIRVWNCDIIVDWADAQEEPDEETMSKVKVLYVRNLKTDFDEDKIKELFGSYGQIARIKKLKDYAFIHYEERDDAVKAMNELHGKEICGSTIQVSLAKPPSDKKKKEEILRNRERRMMSSYQSRGGPLGHSIGRGGRGLPGRPPIRPMTHLPSTDYDYDYDYYGGGGGGGYGGDYRAGYNDLYYDEYYPYEGYYYDYAPPIAPPAATRGRGPRPGMPPGGIGRGAPGRGAVPRGGMPGRGGPGGAQRGMGGPPVRGGMRKPNMTGKRKFDGGNQNQGDPKRRFQSWGGNPSSSAGPSSNAYGGVNGSGANDQWYQDSYSSTWQ